LPEVRVVTPAHCAFTCAFMIGLMLSFIGECVGVHGAAGCGGMIAAVAFAGVCITSRLLPRSVTFGELRTFRDLAVRIANHAPQSRTA
jgi:hypothetical protein